MNRFSRCATVVGAAGDSPCGRLRGLQTQDFAPLTVHRETSRVESLKAQLVTPPAANTSPAISVAASSCIAGMACEQVSGVIETVACPSRSETTLGWMPARRARVAVLRLRLLCELTCGLGPKHLDRRGVEGDDPASTGGLGLAHDDLSAIGDQRPSDGERCCLEVEQMPRCARHGFLGEHVNGASPRLRLSWW
jgi:hypothetical protein